MKKSIVLVLTLLFFVVSFTASVNADIISWTDRQKLDDKLASKPIGDEDGWQDLQGIQDPDNNNEDSFDLIATVADFVAVIANDLFELLTKSDLLNQPLISK